MPIALQQKTGVLEDIRMRGLERVHAHGAGWETGVIPHGVEVFVGVESIDLRWGFDRLAGIVTERVGRPARSGALFMFRGRRGDAIKMVFFDGTGMCDLVQRYRTEALGDERSTNASM